MLTDLIVVAGGLLLAMNVDGEDGVGAAGVLVHVVASNGAVLQSLLRWEFIKEKKEDDKTLFFSWSRSCFLGQDLVFFLLFLGQDLFSFFLGRKCVFFFS